jgi:hypothetical protein
MPLPKGVKYGINGQLPTNFQPGSAYGGSAGRPGIPAPPGFQYGAGPGMAPPRPSQSPPYYASVRPGGYGPPRQFPGGFAPPPPQQMVPPPHLPPHLGGFGAPPPYYSPYQKPPAMAGIGSASPYVALSVPAAFSNGASAPPGPYRHAEQAQYGYYHHPAQTLPMYGGPGSPAGAAAAAAQFPHARATAFSPASPAANTGGPVNSEIMPVDQAQERYTAAAAEYSAAEAVFQQVLRLGGETPVQ